MVLFLSLAVAATILTFLTFQGSVLVWDSSGPFWPFGLIAAPCYIAGWLWLMLWRRLPWAPLPAIRRPSWTQAQRDTASGQAGLAAVYLNTTN